MEIWLNCTNSDYDEIPKEVDCILTKKFSNLKTQNIVINENSILEKNGKSIGVMVNISTQKEQNEALSLIGSVNWILIKCENWKMIPCENLIAAAESSGTKLAAIVENELEVPAIAFALERGIDALVVNKDILEVAIITKLQRLENTESGLPINRNSSSLNLELAKIKEISSQGIGDRVCIDTTSFLNIGEGMLCGSFAKSLALIHAETIKSEFVPTRPFRVNAGGIHSYIMMGDLSTSYLSELKSGDEVLIVNENGKSRIATIGRIKLERRPLIKIKWITKEGNEGDVILQQAETVRLIGTDLKPVSITNVVKNMDIFVLNSIPSRHIGTPIRAFCQEY
jgi:3-dehydroquinate synthase II